MRFYGQKYFGVLCVFYWSRWNKKQKQNEGGKAKQEKNEILTVRQFKRLMINGRKQKEKKGMRFRRENERIFAIIAEMLVVNSHVRGGVCLIIISIWIVHGETATA